MNFYLIGVDHKTAPLAAREDLYRQRGKITDFWGAKDSAVLFTCNRIEVYIAAKNADAALADIAGFAQEFPGFFAYAYKKYGYTEVFDHALRLACGLESQLQGEFQVFDQLNAWFSREKLTAALEELWHKALYLSRYIRSFSGLDLPGQNIANAIYYDIGQRLDHAPVEIVIVGTGKVAGLFADYSGPGACLTVAAHKNYWKAKALAWAAKGKAVQLDDLEKHLLKADVLVSATSHPHYLFDKEYFEKIVSARGRPLYIYDLAVPRDIDPGTRELEGISLSDLDDLTGIFNAYNSRMIVNLRMAENLIEDVLRGVKSHEDDIKDRHAAKSFSIKAG